MSASHRDAMDDQVRAIREREFSRLVAGPDEHALFMSFHPLSLRGSTLSYLDRKGTLLRLAAFMYTTLGLRRKALVALAFAAFHEPWRRRNYRAMRRVMRGERVASEVALEALNERTVDQ
jgi:hypothetical protein